MNGVAKLSALGMVILLFAAVCMADDKATAPDNEKFNQLLQRTSTRMAEFLDQFSDVKCTEQVRQEKLGKDNKVDLKEESTYDYLMILGNEGGELTLSESRIPVHEAKRIARTHPCC